MANRINRNDVSEVVVDSELRPRVGLVEGKKDMNWQKLDRLLTMALIPAMLIMTWHLVFNEGLNDLRAAFAEKFGYSQPAVPEPQLSREQNWENVRRAAQKMRQQEEEMRRRDEEELKWEEEEEDD